MDFLLESIGFPPGTDHDGLIDVVRRRGEGVPWRGDPNDHMRLALGEGLELRVDRDPERDLWTLLPHYQAPQRLRVLVQTIRRIPDSPFDALLEGWAAPPTPEELADGLGKLPGAFPMSAWLTDAKRLPRSIQRGAVIAISVAGFALSLEHCGPVEEARDRAVLELERGCSVTPLVGADDPGGCIELSARVKEVRTLRNGLSGELVRMIVADAPERPFLLFLSRWQLEEDALPLPRPGWRVEGAFLLSGRIAGGLPRSQERVGGAFG